MIVDGKYLRRVGKDVADLAHNAVRGNDRHIGAKLIIGSLVDVEDVRLIASAGANGLRGHRLVDVFLLEVEERLQTLALASILKQRGLFQAQTVDGLLQILVLLADVAQVNIVLPETASAKLGGLNELLWRRDQGIGPQPDQPHAGAVLRV